MRLTQGLLAELICAQRTSVNAAIRELEERGVVRADGVGRWWLYGQPPARYLEDAQLT